MKTPEDLISGDKCWVNGKDDLARFTTARRFIGRPCTFVRVTAAGLFQVALESDSTQMISVPKRNISLPSE